MNVSFVRLLRAAGSGRSSSIVTVPDDLVQSFGLVRGRKYRFTIETVAVGSDAE